ncbi:MAG TPA: hypothetical protein EYQ31_03960 [Candidatus Handelsmanbacteria bacterium]|nr:hypothetical protein [Candidatus Handelsmanbacteria bacterium]
MPGVGVLATAAVAELLALLLELFFDGDALVDRVCAVLDDPDRMPEMRAAARRTAIETYDLATVCLPRQLELIQTLVSGGRPITDH